MKKKHLVILLMVAAIIGVIGLLIYQKQSADWSGRASGIGEKVLPDFPVNDVQSLTVNNGSETAEIVKKGDKWQVRNRYGYPADFARIKQNLMKLRTMKIVQSFTVSPEEYGQIQVNRPSEENDEKTGVSLLCKNSKGDKVADIILGKNHRKKSGGGMMSMMSPGSVGRYIRVADYQKGEEKTVLVSESFRQFSADPADWLDPEFVKIENPEKIMLQDTSDGSSWTLRKNDDGDWLLEGMQEGKNLKDSAVRRLAGAFERADFEDVAAPSIKAEDTGLNKPKVVTYFTENGLRYTLRFGGQIDDDDGYYLRLHASYIGAQDAKQKKGDTEEGDEEVAEKDDAQTEDEKKSVAELKEKVEKINSKYGNWTYIIPKRTANRVLKTRDELAENKKKHEAEQTEKAKNESTSSSG